MDVVILSTVMKRAGKLHLLYSSLLLLLYVSIKSSYSLFNSFLFLVIEMSPGDWILDLLFHTQDLPFQTQDQYYYLQL